MAGERTEKATPQRREKASRDGDLVHSRELSSAAGMLAGVMLLGYVARRFLGAWMTAASGYLELGSQAHWESGAVDKTLQCLVTLTIAALAPIGVMMAAVAGASLAVGMLQTGGLRIYPKVLGFRFDRVNPLTNLQNLFSLRAVTRLGKSMIPVAVLAVFAANRLARQWEIAPFSSVRLTSLAGDVYDLLRAAALLFFAWALIDYGVEWRSREQRLRMSKQEMREEYKESQGNPQIRARIRNLQRQARRRRVKADVRRAAVVVTNPTHYAVALDFDFETMDAPKVLAKGRNLLAEEIKEEARWAGVPILENPPLARSLYRSVHTGDAIPLELYAAVASILAFLYRRRVEEEMQIRRRNAQPKTEGHSAQGSEPVAARIPGLVSRSVPESDSDARRNSSGITDDFISSGEGIV